MYLFTQDSACRMQTCKKVEVIVNNIIVGLSVIFLHTYLNAYLMSLRVEHQVENVLLGISMEVMQLICCTLILLVAFDIFLVYCSLSTGLNCSIIDIIVYIYDIFKYFFALSISC